MLSCRNTVYKYSITDYGPIKMLSGGEAERIEV